MLIVILVFIAIIYVLTLLIRSGSKFNARTTNTIRVFLFVFAPVLTALLILGQLNIYPRGYWFTKGLFWIVVSLMMILFGLGNRSTFSKLEKVVYGFFFYLPLAFLPFLLVHVIGIGTALLFYVSFIGDSSLILYSDDHIRVQQQYIKFLSPNPPLEIFVKDGFFSHRDTVLAVMYSDKTDSLSVRQLDDTTYSLVHYAPESWEVPGGSEEFRFSIRSKQK